MQQAAILALHKLSNLTSPFVLVSSFNAPSSTTTITSSHFVTFLVLLPWGVKFTNDPETQVVLASIPLLIIGFSGILMSGFESSMGRMSRPFIDLSFCTLAALMAGIFELTNVLVAEFNGAQFLGRGLLISEGLAMAAFTSFKFMFLYHQTQQPSIHERASSRESIVLSKSPSKQQSSVTSRTPTLNSSNRRSQFHSSSYEKWGTSGKPVKLLVLVTVLVTTLLEGVWRFGSSSRFQSFITIYKASGIFQVILLSFFFLKFLANAYFTDAAPRKRNFIEIFPYLLGIIFGMTNSALSLIPGFILLTESPLGRFLSMVEVYIFLLTVTIEDHRRLFEDLPPSDDDALLLPPILPRYVTSPSKKERPASPSLPERITVRRSSRIPSWLPMPNYLDRMNERSTVTSDQNRSNSNSDSPSSPIEFDLFYDTEDQYLRPPSALGNLNLNVTYEGRDSLAFPASIHLSESNYRQSIATTVRATAVPDKGKSAIRTRNISVGRYNKNGIRLSSPNLDEEFSFVQKQDELDEVEISFNSLQRSSSRNNVSFSSSPRSTSTSPAARSKILPSIPLSSALPKNIPVPMGIGIDTSLYTQPPFLKKNTSSAKSNTPTTTTTNSRKNSDTSVMSGFSLSTFPVPPSVFESTSPLKTRYQYRELYSTNTQQRGLAQRPETSLTNYSRSTNNGNFIVAEGGIEFELCSPLGREAEGKEDDKTGNLGSRRGLNASNINITSLIVGQNSLHQHSSPSYSDEVDGLDSPIMPVSPGEISTASIISRAGSRAANGGGGKLRFDGTGVGVSRSILGATSFSRKILKPFSSNNASSSELLDQQSSYGSTSTSHSKTLPRTPSPPSPALTELESVGGGGGRYDPEKPFERPRPAPLVLNTMEGLNRK